MLATAEAHRGKDIATTVVKKVIDAMKALKADESVLETEISNTVSLRLYEHPGFLRTKRLYRYYLNGNAAFRLAISEAGGELRVRLEAMQHGDGRMGGEMLMAV